MLAVIQQLAKPPLGSGRGGKYSRSIGFENHGNLVAAHAHDVSEKQHGPLLIRQLGHGGREVAGSPLRRDRGNQIWYFTMEHLATPLSAPNLIEASETNAAEQPRSERPTITADGRCRFDQLEKSLLHGVLGRGPVSENRERE